MLELPSMDESHEWGSVLVDNICVSDWDFIFSNYQHM